LGAAGLSVARVLQRDGILANNAVLYGFFVLSLGLSLQIFLVFILALIGCLTGSAVIATAGAILCLSVVWLWRYQPSINHLPTLPCNYWLLLSTIAFFLIVLLVSYHSPGVWDDTMY